MTSLPLLDDSGLMAALRSTVELARSAHAQVVSVVGEMQRRGIDAHAGYKSLAELLKHAVRMDPREAKKLLAQADALCSSVSSTGTDLEPVLPLVAEAAADGVLSATHLDVLVGAMAELPAQYEQDLVDVARLVDPSGVRIVANRIRAYVDQDGKEPDDPDLVNPKNTLRLRKKRDGRVEFAGTLGPVEGAKFEALLSPLSKPRPTDANGPDTRTVLERQGDGFADLLDLASRSTDLPREAGERPHVMVTMTWNDLLAGHGVATLGNDTLLGIPEGKRLACVGDIIPCLIGTTGEVLELGRTTRRISTGLRKALRQRDGGCAFPGVQPASDLVRRPPHQALAERRDHRPRQPRTPLRTPPPGHPPHRVGHPDDQPNTVVHPTGTHRPVTKTTAQSATRPGRVSGPGR